MQSFNYVDTSVIIAAIVAYIAFTSWLTVKLRSKTSAEFLVGGRTVPAIVVGVLLMSEFIGAKSTIGVAQAAFEFGIAAAWAVLSAAIAFPLFGFFLAKKLYSSGEYTISGVIAQRFGRSTELVVSLIMIYALLMVNVGNYVSGAASLATILKVNLPTAAFIIAVVSTFYFALGGFKSVAYVSMVHCTIKYVGVFVVLGAALYMTKGIAADRGSPAAVLFYMGRPYRRVYRRGFLHRQYRRGVFDPIYHPGRRLDQEARMRRATRPISRAS